MSILGTPTGMSGGTLPQLSGRGRGVLGGCLAGFVGGLVLAFYMLGMSLFKGQDIWAGMKMAGYPFLKEQAMLPGFAFGAVIVGMLCHLAVSIAWGALFGGLFLGRSRKATLALGAVWGLVVWAGMFYGVLPMVGLGYLVRTMPVGPAILEHILFGLAVALAFLPYQPRTANA